MTVCAVRIFLSRQERQRRSDLRIMIDSQSVIRSSLPPLSAIAQIRRRSDSHRSATIIRIPGALPRHIHVSVIAVMRSLTAGIGRRRRRRIGRRSRGRRRSRRRVVLGTILRSVLILLSFALLFRILEIVLINRVLQEKRLGSLAGRLGFQLSLTGKQFLRARFGLTAKLFKLSYFRIRGI